MNEIILIFKLHANVTDLFVEIKRCNKHITVLDIPFGFYFF